MKNHDCSTIKPGDRFGRLTVVRHKTDKRFICKCDCHDEEIAVYGLDLLNGHKTTCGNCEKYGMPRKIKAYDIDLTGRTSGDLTVIAYDSERTNHRGIRMAYWKCKCKCGNEVVVSGREIQRQHVMSCGKCGYHARRMQELKKYNTADEYRLLDILNAMKGRCYLKSNPEYHRYGGRGICVCDEWMGDRKVFVDWALNNGYRQGLTIERKDNDKGYSPDNCCWVDRFVQMNNTSKNYWIDTDAGKFTRAQCMRITGETYDRLRSMQDHEIRCLVEQHLEPSILHKEKREFIEELNVFFNENLSHIL